MQLTTPISTLSLPGEMGIGEEVTLTGIGFAQGDAAITYNKAVDLAHQAGISKNFPENYIEELSASSYADIYQQISLSPTYLSYLKGLPRK